MLEVIKIDDKFLELVELVKGVLMKISVFGGFFDNRFKNIYVRLVLFFVNVWVWYVDVNVKDVVVGLLLFFVFLRVDKKVICNKFFVGMIKILYVKKFLFDIFFLFEMDVDFGILVVCERFILGRVFKCNFWIMDLMRNFKEFEKKIE